MFKERRQDWGYGKFIKNFNHLVQKTVKVLIFRFWIGDYLSYGTEHENEVQLKAYCSALSSIHLEHPFERILFSSYIHKINRYNKSSVRALLVTDRFIAKLDIKRFKLLKGPIDMFSVWQILCIRILLVRFR